MPKSYYDLLGVERTAPADEIKRAFRREIAKYHPDKVQHLGPEFQDIAASKAAELTLAYKTLTDAAARADYDGQLGADPPAAGPTVAVSQPPAANYRPSNPEPPSGSGSWFAAERAGAIDLVYRAMLARFRKALETEFGTYEGTAVQGFEITCIPKPGRWSLKQPPTVLGRFVPRVDAAAISESWSLASRMKRDTKGDVCVFVMGPAVAPAGELAAVITEQRRRPSSAGGKLVLVPVNTQTWAAHVPTDAPAVVKSLLSKLQST